MHLRAFLLAAAIFFGISAGRAESVQIQCTADTALHEVFPTHNLGGALHLPVGATAKTVSGHPARTRGLLRFDLANRIPPGATVTSATVRVKVLFVPTFDDPVVAEHDLLRMNLGWIEGRAGGQAGDVAIAGEPSWSHSAFPTTWSGGADNAVQTAPSATTSIGGPGEYVFNSTPELVGDITRWMTNAEENFGWMLRSRAENALQTARRFGSKEVEGNAAVLEIEYSLNPAQPLKFETIRLEGNQVFISWSGGTPPFLLEMTTDLATRQWNAVGAPTADTSIQLPRPGPHAFFRLVDKVTGP